MYPFPLWDKHELHSLVASPCQYLFQKCGDCLQFCMSQVLLSRIKLVLILVWFTFRSVTLDLSSCIRDSFCLSVNNKQLKVKRKVLSGSYSQDPKPNPVQSWMKWEMPHELLFTGLEVIIYSWAGGIPPGRALQDKPPKRRWKRPHTERFCLLRMCSEIHESWTIFQWMTYLAN